MDRVCTRCLLRDLAEKDQAELQKYLQVIKQQDKADSEVYEKRLQVCRQCELLLDATCQACGCYVEFRAAVRHGRCPKKKW